MNKWNGIGRLTKDADIHYLQNENNTCVAKFNLAVDRKIKRNGEPLKVQKFCFWSDVTNT